MDRIRLTIDEKEIEAVAGMTIFQAVSSAGIDIPHLCYQPKFGLEPTGASRLCIVEEIRGEIVKVISMKENHLIKKVMFLSRQKWPISWQERGQMN